MEILIFAETDDKGNLKKDAARKLRWVPGLSGAAQKLLRNIKHMSQKLPGTQET